MDESDKKLLENIAKFGCQVMHISGEDDLPPFAYSVGIQKSSSAPEVVVIGLKQPLAHSVVNTYNNRIRNGEKFEIGKNYPDFIEGFEVLVSKVDKSHFQEYFGFNRWLYDGDNFDIVQLVYPNTSGVWPWQKEADDWFRSWQPILASASSE
jgi:Domain of unknown function (DUF4262)